MLRKFIFLDQETGQEIVLPVSPASYRIHAAQGVQIVNMTQFGDYALAGQLTIEPFTLDCMLPAQDYPFLTAGGTANPAHYLQFFQTALRERHLLRFVISDTAVSCEVLVSRLEYGEQDGTNDVYAVLELTPYRRLQAIAETRAGSAITAVTEGAVRSTDAPQTTQQNHVVARGDTLWEICRRYYGDGTLYPALAAYNGIANPDLIYDGDVIRLPPKEQL